MTKPSPFHIRHASFPPFAEKYVYYALSSQKPNNIQGVSNFMRKNPELPNWVVWSTTLPLKTIVKPTN